MAQQKRKKKVSQKGLQDESVPELNREERAWRVAQLAAQLSLRFPLPSSEDGDPRLIADEKQDSFYEACAFRAEHILGYAAGTKGTVHAADLFEPEVLYTAEEIAAVFASYEWPNLTDDGTIGELLVRLRDQVSKALNGIGKKVPNKKVDLEDLESRLVSIGKEVANLEKNLGSHSPSPTDVTAWGNVVRTLTRVRKGLIRACGAMSEGSPDPTLEHLEAKLVNLEDLLDSKRGYFFHEIALICRDLGWEPSLLIRRSKLKNPPVPKPADSVPDHHLPRNLQYFEGFLAKLFGFHAHWRFVDWHPYENTGFLSHRNICPDCGAKCVPEPGARTATATRRLRVFETKVTLKLTYIRLYCPQEDKVFRMPFPDYLENKSPSGETAVASSVVYAEGQPRRKRRSRR